MFNYPRQRLISLLSIDMLAQVSGEGVQRICEVPVSAELAASVYTLA